MRPGLGWGGLNSNRSGNSKNLFSYLNISSIRNEFDNIMDVIINYLNIFIAAETKISKSFPNAQLMIEHLENLPLRLYATNKRWAGLLVFMLDHTYFASVIEIYHIDEHSSHFFRNHYEKGEMVFLSIQKTLSQNCQSFLDPLHNIIDIYSDIYDNHIA